MQQSWSFLIVLLSLVYVMFSCGQKSSKDEIAPSTDQPLTTGELRDFQVSCEDGQNCPGYLASVRVYNPDSPVPATCIGFLLDSQTLITSNSCIQKTAAPPSRVRDCESVELAILFPKTERFPEETAGCVSIQPAESLTNLNNPLSWKQDYAVVGLDRPVSRESLGVTQAGVTADQKVLIWQLNGGEKQGLLGPTPCRVKLAHLVNPNATKGHSPQMVLADCPVSSDTAGSPILDGKSGEAVGILSAPLTELQKEQLSKFHINHVDFAYGSNFACSRLLGRPIPSEHLLECQKDLSTGQGVLQALRPTFFPELAQELSTILGEKSSYGAPVIDWMVQFGRPELDGGGPSTDNSNGQIFVRFGLLPRCFFDKKLWMDRKLEKSMKKFSLFGWISGKNWKKSYTLRWALPVYGIRLQLDTELVPRYSLAAGDIEKMGPAENYQLEVEFSPKSLFSDANGFTTVRMRLFDMTGDSPELIFDRMMENSIGQCRIPES